MKFSEYLKIKPDYLDYAIHGGCNLTDQYTPRRVYNLGDIYQPVWDWSCANLDRFVDHSVKTQPYHEGETIKGSGLPGTVGYNEENTYYASAEGDDLADLIGGDELFEKIGMLRERSNCRLMIMTPGSIIPWHSDTMQRWRQANADINPHLVMTTEFGDKMMSIEEAAAQSVCDLGQIGRRLIAVSPWHWGHIMQFQNTVLTGWASGQVLDSPPCVWHLTANVGIVPRLSMVITGILR